MEQSSDSPDRAPPMSLSLSTTSAVANFCERRRLSTSSTVSADVDGITRASHEPEVSPATRTASMTALESRLALRRRLAPLVKFSCQADPSFRHCSVVGKQSGQQARNGTV